MTKKRQPPLLDPSGNDLPSPLFAARPGWGGQLSLWLKENAYGLVFRLVLFAAIILVGTSITKHRPQQAVAPTPSPTPVADDGYEQTAKPGEGLNHLAARALDAYLVKTDRKLDAVEHLWAVDRLVNAAISLSSVYVPQDIKPGQVIRFPGPAIEYAIMEAEGLTPSQRAKLLQYLR